MTLNDAVRPLVDDPRGGPWLLLAVVWLLVLLSAGAVVVGLGGALVLAIRRTVHATNRRRSPENREGPHG